MTILEALNGANNKLKKIGIDSPMLDAEILLSHVLGVRKSWLFSHFSDPLREHNQEAFIRVIDRRLKHEPIAYITGTKSFYGRSFQVSPDVLIPRPATETLVETALEIARTSNKDATLVADIGTGSGALAISIALETGLPVIASDMSDSAISVAKQNAETLGATDIDFKQGDLLTPIFSLFTSIRASKEPKISSVYPFETLIICANLPYLNDEQMRGLERSVIFEPDHALRSGVDGLDHYFRFFRELNRHRQLLPRKTFAIIEIDPSQTKKAVEIITHSFPGSIPSVRKDLQENDRIISVQI